jgi:hypothetical protein
MQVISINDKTDAKKKADLLEILDHLRAEIENGSIEEFVASSIHEDGEVQIHVASKDFIGAIGLFEIGKTILISREA